MIKTCKNCRWWGVEYENCCDRVNHDAPPPIMFGIDASADDDSNLHARLVTSPDFGCSEFDYKSAKDAREALEQNVEPLAVIVKKWRDDAKKLRDESKVESQFSSDDLAVTMMVDGLRDRAGEIEKCADELERHEKA